MLAHKLHELRARRAAGETGFTLVELLVVVVIIVALAAIAVPIFLNQKGKADEARLSSDATSAGKILASAVSQGAQLCTDEATPNCTVLANDTNANTIYFQGQSLTSDGNIKVFGWQTGGGWNAADACVQVTAEGVTYRYKIQGGSEKATCVAAAAPAN